MSTFTYSRYEITTMDGGKALLRWETNDNNDDGLPDGTIATRTWLLTMEKAKDMAGTSRTGAWQQPVEVYLDGQQI